MYFTEFQITLAAATIVVLAIGVGCLVVAVLEWIFPPEKEKKEESDE